MSEKHKMENIKKREPSISSRLSRLRSSTKKKILKYNDSISDTHTDIKDKFQIKKQIGLLGATSVVTGVIIGSGIFMTPGAILDNVGSVGASLCVWLGCGIFALLTTLSYMELGLIINESGAEYPYCVRAFGDLVGFLCAWGLALIAKPASFLLMLYTFAEYMLALFDPGCPSDEKSMKNITCVALLSLTFINLISVKFGEAITKVLMFVKLGVMALIILAGVVQVINGKTKNFNNIFENTATNPLVYANAFYSGMWSFDGWNQLNFIVEEMKDPVRDFPRAVWLSIPLITTIYILINCAYFTVMTPDEIINSGAVAVTFAYRTIGVKFAWIVPLGVVLSSLGAANGTIFTSARLTWVASRRSHLPQILSYIDVRRFTPSVALLFNCAIALLMTLPNSSNFSSVLDFFSFVQWLFYGLSCLSVVIFRYTDPYKNHHRPYTVPIFIPIIAAAISFYLVLAPVIDNPVIQWLYVTIALFSGLAFYVPLHILGLRPKKFMQGLTCIMQQILQVAPSEVLPDDM